MRKKLICTIFTVVFLSVFLTGCGKSPEQANAGKEATSVSSDNKALKFFKDKNPDKKVIVCSEDDVTGDSKKDLVVIYQETDKKNSMVVIISKGETYETTNSVPAPIKNQKIEFKDIDKKAPMEFMVSGSKGSNFGYAIFKVEGTKLSDLFGSDMEKCCG